MKKLFLMCAALTVAILTQAASFGILVNGTKYFAGNLNTGQASFTEYAILSVPLAEGDECVIYDFDNKGAWVENLDNASTANIVKGDGKYTVSVAGCYDFYLKMFGFENNQLYVGVSAHSDCTDYSTTLGGGTQGGGEQGGDGSSTGEKDYFLKGYRNGEDITTPTAEEQFEHGMLTYTFTGKAPDTKGYFFILVCDKGQVIGKQYMAAAYTEGGTSCVLVPDGAQTWGVQEGTVTFYLYKDEGDSYTLAIEPIAGRIPVDAEQTPVSNVENDPTNAVRYNLLGMPVSDDYQGITIQNGKKQIRL